jgi:hypothetical protein
MGLEVSVGAGGVAPGDGEALAHYQGQLDRLGDALAERGIAWREPVGVPVPAMRAHVGGFPCSCLAYLRRAVALQGYAETVPPVGAAGITAQDERRIRDETSMLSSHLLCHADNAGYFVPVDFPEPLFLAEDIAGNGMIGSSHGLMDELRGLAPVLGITLTRGGELTDEEAARIFALPDGADFAVETMVWLTLFEACRVSIAGGHAVIFH